MRKQSSMSSPAEASTAGLADLAALIKGEKPLPPTSEPMRVVGIDLGTTNSTVSVVTSDPGAPGPLGLKFVEVEQPTYEGVYTHTLVPSVVALHNGRELVGEGAKRLRSRIVELNLRQN